MKHVPQLARNDPRVIARECCCFSTGGVELWAQKFRIKVENTLDSRLEMMSEQAGFRRYNSFYITPL